MLLPFLALLISSCTNYGKKMEFGAGEVYYTDAVTEDMAKNLGDYLVKTGYFNDDPKSVKIDKDGEKGYTLNLVVKEEVIDDPQYAELVKMFSWQISEELLHGEPITMVLTDETFTPKKTFPFEPMPQPEMPAPTGSGDSLALDSVVVE